MPTYYIAEAPLGDDATLDGTDPATPYLTYGAAEAAASDGDTIVILGSEYDIPSGNYINTTKDVTVKGESRSTVLRKDPAHSVRIVYLSASTTTTDEPTWRDMTVDGEGLCTYCFNTTGSATASEVMQWINVTARGATSMHFNNDRPAGVQEYINCKIDGDTQGGVSTTSTGPGTSGDQVVNVRKLDVNGTTLLTSSASCVRVERANTATFRVSGFVDGVFGNVDFSATPGGCPVIFMYGTDSPVVRNCNFKFTHTHTANEAFGIQILGKSTYTTTGATVADNVIHFDSPAGYGIGYGDSPATNSYISGGAVVGNHVTGSYYLSSTPHNIAMRTQTTGVCSGNVSRDSYVGILLNETTSCECTGNLLFDNYGSSIYIKGVAGATVENNVCVVSSGVLQRVLGILHVTNQTGNTTAATIQNNTVIVQDVSDIGGFLAAVDTGNVCNFDNNLYIIPDSASATANYFRVNGTPTNLTGWLADSRVTGDRIMQLPQADIDALVANYRSAAAKPESGSGNGSFGIGI
jgi:hypothetical protein